METCSKPFKDKEKHMDDLKKNIFLRGIAFHSEPRNGLFETHGIPRKEHFIPRNNGNQSGILMANPTWYIPLKEKNNQCKLSVNCQ